MRKKRSKLRSRALRIDWKLSTIMAWVVTTDPKTIDPLEALETINRRWHLVHRSLSRIVPHLRYFKILELTKSGLPHLHILTDCFIPKKQFEAILIHHRFGEFVSYVPFDSGRATAYITKYINKCAYNTDVPPGWPAKSWSSSRYLLPIVEFVVEGEEWTVVHVDFHRALDQARSHVTLRGPPTTIQKEDPC